jgi:hypothetical protein
MSDTALVVRPVFRLQVFVSFALNLPRPFFLGCDLALEAAARRASALAFCCPGSELFSVVEYLGPYRVVTHAAYLFPSRVGERFSAQSLMLSNVLLVGLEEQLVAPPNKSKHQTINEETKTAPHGARHKRDRLQLLGDKFLEITVNSHQSSNALNRSLGTLTTKPSSSDLNSTWHPKRDVSARP